MDHPIRHEYYNGKYCEYTVSHKYHRLDGPAKIWSNGREEWFQNDKLYRLDGPAIVTSGGYQAWYINNKRHRKDGPAVMHPNGDQEWWVDGNRHRLDGPAIIWSDGSVEWWINHECITKGVCAWIVENDIPPWKKWGIEMKTLFTLAFR